MPKRVAMQATLERISPVRSDTLVYLYYEKGCRVHERKYVVRLYYGILHCKNKKKWGRGEIAGRPADPTISSHH